jgi:hypothetical protein
MLEDVHMPKPGNKIHIPLPEKQALELLMKVKPTGEMPRHRKQFKPKKKGAK